MIWWFVGSLAVFLAWAVLRRNWWAIGAAAVPGVLALVNDEMYWLAPINFGAAAVALVLIVVAPRPAWVTLVIAAFAALAVRTGELATRSFGPYDLCANGGLCTGGSYPEWYTGWTDGGEQYLSQDGEKLYSPGGGLTPFVELPFHPAWLVVAGVLGWAIRRRSWRVAVVAVVIGAMVQVWPYQGAVVLFAAAAAALGPRKDVHYLVGLGILTLALLDQPTLAVTIVTIFATLTLCVWALIKKNGVNGAVAVVSLAVAPLTPFLTAGVLLAYAPIRRTAERSAGTPCRAPAR